MGVAAVRPVGRAVGSDRALGMPGSVAVVGTICNPTGAKGEARGLKLRRPARHPPGRAAAGDPHGNNKRRGRHPTDRRPVPRARRYARRPVRTEHPGLAGRHRGALRRAAGRAVPRAGRPLDLARVRHRGRRAGGRLAGPGPAARRPAGHLVAEPRRMAGDAVRHRAHRRDPGQHQPGLPAVGAGVRAQPVGLPRHRHGRAAEDLDVPADAADAGAGAGAQRARRAEGRAAAGAAVGDPHGRRGHARHAELRRAAGTRPRQPAAAAAGRDQRAAELPRRRSTSSSPAAPPATPRARR